MTFYINLKKKREILSCLKKCNSSFKFETCNSQDTVMKF